LGVRVRFAKKKKEERAFAMRHFRRCGGEKVMFWRSLRHAL
jgi:hypothetical protein